MSRGTIPRITSDGTPNVFGFPPRILTKLRYVDTYALSSSAGSIAKQVFNINSIFDPDQSGVGHQPMYRDTFAAIYDQYAVINANVTVTFNSNATTASMIVGGLFDDDTSTSTNITTLLEQNTGKHLFLPNATGALSSRTLKFNWDCQKMLGINPYTSQSYKTANGSNPTELMHLLIYAAPADGSSTTVTTALVEVDFTVLFTELVTPTGS